MGKPMLVQELSVREYYRQLLEFIKETDQIKIPSYALVAYCMGYYGVLTPNCWEAIGLLVKRGWASWSYAL